MCWVGWGSSVQCLRVGQKSRVTRRVRVVLPQMGSPVVQGTRPCSHLCLSLLQVPTVAGRFPCNCCVCACVYCTSCPQHYLFVEFPLPAFLPSFPENTLLTFLLLPSHVLWRQRSPSAFFNSHFINAKNGRRARNCFMSSHSCAGRACLWTYFVRGLPPCPAPVWHSPAENAFCNDSWEHQHGSRQRATPCRLTEDNPSAFKHQQHCSYFESCSRDFT